MPGGGIVIDNVRPQVDGGRCPAKRKVGDSVVVSANIFSHGADLLDAALLFREAGQEGWSRHTMHPGDNDRWIADFAAVKNTTYQFTIEAWVDRYSTWLGNVKKWHQAGEDTTQDIRTGIRMLREATAGASPDAAGMQRVASKMENADGEDALRIASDSSTVELARRMQRKEKVRYEKVLEVFVDRKIAGLGSWYELFPRSQGRRKGRHGTFADCAARLDDIAGMGFDVLYLTPVHPIGITNRRGRNGSPQARRNDVGSPWAIGTADGGHKSIHSRLGSMEDFKRLIEQAKNRGVEIALDIAFQCSPDHPYVKEHPEWFYHRSDGSIRYAENPPKKYFDIYPLDFRNSDWKGLWEELRSIFLFWIEAGVRIFRVDNPHTKPFEFWEWAIGTIRKEHPDVVFLSEAFTRPNVMYELSKIGFTQSYTYFTWKNFNWELEEYFAEISRQEVTDFFRPNLFTNTPDILPFVLQTGGRPAFIMRALLAATLSPVWGMYSGFELCENEALPDREEYLNSEKFEIRQRDWNRQGNIKQFIARLNSIRREQPALQQLGEVHFIPTDNPSVVFYTRRSQAHDSQLMVVVNINPFDAQGTVLRVPLGELGLGPDQDFGVKDLLTGEKFSWHGEYNYVRLIPGERAGHIFALER